MAKLTLTDISSGYGLTTTINANNALVEAALENTLSRDGTGPNTMQAALDMNSYNINNLPNATQNQQPVTLSQAATIAGVTNALSRENVAGVLFPQTSEEVTAAVTPTYYYYEPGDVRRYGAVGDGATDNSTPFAECASVDDGIFYVPTGTFNTSTATAILSNTTVYGDGKCSNIVATTTNQNAVFTITDKTNVTIRDLLLTGSNTASTSSNGTGILATDSDDLEIRSVNFTLFGNNPVKIQGDDAGGHDNFKVINCLFYDNELKVVGSEGGEVNVSGAITNVLVTGCRFEADATTPYARGIFIANNGASLNWSDINITDCYFDGYSNNGIGVTDENPSGTFDNGILLIKGNIVKNSTETGIKIKNGYRNIITANYLENNDTTPEIAGNLQGTIQVNSSNNSVISDNIIISAGTDGIKVFGLATASGGDITGKGRAGIVISGNTIEAPAEDGIFVTNDIYDVTIVGNVVRDAGQDGISVAAEVGVGKDGDHVTITGNVCRDCGAGANNRGINVARFDYVTISGNTVRGSGAYGLLVSSCDHVSINGGVYVDNGQNLGARFGIGVDTCANVTISGVRSGNDSSTDQQYGLRIVSTTDMVVEGCDFSGNATSAISGDTQAVIYGHNIDYILNRDTAANIADVAAAINTDNKYAGKLVRDTTNNRLMIARTSAAAGPWDVVDGSASVTPA